MYDEVKDISLHANSGTSESTLSSVYATAQLPAVVYDNPTFYSTQQTTQLTGADGAASSSDELHMPVQHLGNSAELQTVYDEIKDLHESPLSTVYATTQQPTDLSNAPTYASMSG